MVRLRASEVLPDLVKAIADNTKGPKTREKEGAKNMKTILKFLSTESKERSRKAKAQ